jgi:hypothetical protein
MAFQEQKPKNTDEIDLTYFFAWIGKGFTRMGNGFLYSLAGLRNLFFENRLFFIGIIVAGLMLGAAYSELLKKKYYQSTMVLSCDYLNTQTLKNTIEKLNLLCAEPARQGLAEALNVSESIAKSIQRFDYQSFVSEDDVVEMEVLREQLNNVTGDKKELVDKVIDRLEIENKNAYQISVQVYSPDIVKPLEKALVNYFNSNDYIKRRIEINRTNLLSRREKLRDESSKLDSLKSVLFRNYQNFAKSSRGSNNVILSEENFTPLEVFKQDLEINEELLEVEEDLYLRPDFEVVDGFTTFQQPESASLVTILFLSFLISWAIGYLIIGLWRFDKYLATYKATES